MSKITVELSEEDICRIADRVAERVGHQGVSPWMDAKQAAEYLGCPVGRIHDLVALGKLPRTKEGRRLVFRREVLDAVVEEVPHGLRVA